MLGLGACEQRSLSELPLYLEAYREFALPAHHIDRAVLRQRQCLIDGR